MSILYPQLQVNGRILSLMNLFAALALLLSLVQSKGNQPVIAATTDSNSPTPSASTLSMASAFCPSAIAFGQTIQCSISSAAKADRYTFIANVDDKVRVLMTRKTETLRPRFRIYDQSGKLVCEANSGNPTAGIGSCTLVSAGTYTILADDTFLTNIGNYTLSLQRLNKPGNVRHIGNFGQTFTGTISDLADANAFTFVASVDDKVRVLMTRKTETLRPRIRIYDQRGNLVCEANSGNPTAGIGSCTLVSAGTYTILADDTFLTNIGNYKLSLQRLNKPGSASSLTFGQTLTGTISDLGDANTFTFVVSVDDKVRVLMTRATDTLQPRIRIYNPSGNLVCEANSGNPTAGIGSCTLVSAGTYTILADDTFLTNIGNYTLSLECLNSSCAASPPPTCELAPNGLNTCALEPGDVLLQKWNSLENIFFMGIGGTYFTHAAIYVGDGRIVEAVGAHVAAPDQVIEQSLTSGGWTNTDVYDWVVIRPNTTTTVKQSAVAYARAKAADPSVTYILADKNSEQGVYCSQLVWKAYKQAGIDLEVDRGGTLTDIISLSRLVTPDDLFYSSGRLANRSTVVQSRASSVDRSLWRWTLWILSPGHLTIIDAQGRRSGFDTATNTVLDDIPGVIYSGPDAAVETISVTNPAILGADWQLVVTGFEAGTYKIEAGSVDNENPPSQILMGSTVPGKVETFTIPDPNTIGEITIMGQQDIYLPLVQR